MNPKEILKKTLSSFVILLIGTVGYLSLMACADKPANTAEPVEVVVARTTTPQIKHPAKWSQSVKKISDTEYELVMKVSIEDKWHLYSPYQEFKGDGPLPAVFTFTPNKKNYQLAGKIVEGKATRVKDESFDTIVRYFEKQAVFIQKIKRISSDAFKITGSLSYQVCSESCINEDEKLEFNFDKTELPKAKDTVSAKAAVLTDTNKTTKIDSVERHDSLHTSTATAIVMQSAPVKEEKHSSWGIFIAGFLGGLLALLTPCVFPMIPLTVSFFTKRSKTREKGIANALIYGFSIIALYVSLGLIITLSLGPDALNALSSNVFMNLAFFVIFVVFAISFLGAFEINLPSSWINKADSAADRGGLIGIFFMAFTLSLVSFSCTGPIIGTLLVEAAVGGNVLNPTLGMAGFATALALPFALFAAFPGWLNSLPKSGGWLNSVKVVLGLLELALALKFFSNVDLAYHWGILKREVFLALWIVIFSMLGLYLMGKLKFSHDSETQYVSIPRALLGIVTFSFVVYLIPGMFGAPLKLISGFPPPAFYNEGWSISGNGSGKMEKVIEGTDPEHCPHNLSCFHDYAKALAYAKQVNKPLMVDFTGWNCANCRRMEEKVWVDPSVLEQLKNDYVLVSLYVDDKTELPATEQYTSTTTGRQVKTTGNKWSDMQTTRFMTNAQPWYVLLDKNEKELIAPTGTASIEDFAKYLEMGKQEFSKRK